MTDIAELIAKLYAEVEAGKECAALKAEVMAHPSYTAYMETYWGLDAPENAHRRAVQKQMEGGAE